MKRTCILLIDLFLETIHRLKRVPTRTLHFLRSLFRSILPPPTLKNPYYAHLQEIKNSGRTITHEDVHEVIVPLLLERGKEIAQLRKEVARSDIRQLILYFIMGFVVAMGAYFGQNFLEGTRAASRANCNSLDAVIAFSGADGSPTISGELQLEYREALERMMPPERLARVRALKMAQEHAGIAIKRPDCDRIVKDPESIQVVTVPASTLKRKIPAAPTKTSP